MRPIAVFIVPLLVATSAMARPAWLPSVFQQHSTAAIDLTRSATLHESPSDEDLNLPFFHHSLQQLPSDGSVLPHLRLGPFTAEIGGFDGRHFQMVHYRLEGVSLLGSNIGGSVDGRGAKLSLTWPLSN